MGRKRKPRVYQIPDNVLNNLSEHCAMGWMLFCRPNEESGFQTYSNFGSEIEFSALKSDILRYLNAIEMIENQQVLQGILGN